VKAPPDPRERGDTKAPVADTDRHRADRIASMAAAAVAVLGLVEDIILSLVRESDGVRGAGNITPGLSQLRKNSRCQT